MLTQHGLPITCGKHRGLGPAGKSGADFRDHIAKGLVVLNGPVGLEIIVSNREKQQGERQILDWG